MRIEGLKNQTLQIFPVDFQLKTPTPKILAPLKRTEPKCGQKEKQNQKQRMNEPVRKSLRVEGLENRRPSILICATCVSVHRSTMIFFCFLLFCFVLFLYFYRYTVCVCVTVCALVSNDDHNALKVFLQRCKKELLQWVKGYFFNGIKKGFFSGVKKYFFNVVKSISSTVDKSISST